MKSICCSHSTCTIYTSHPSGLCPGHLEALATSSNPRNWLISFEERCRLAVARQISYVDLTHSFVMLGVGPDLEPDLSTPKPMDFDNVAYSLLKKYNLISKVRRVLREDLRSTNDYPEYGQIALKSYTKLLLKYFLVNKKD